MLVRSIVLIVSLGCGTATVPRAAFAQTESKSLAVKNPSDFEIDRRPGRALARDFC
jgi:hypothetical protein